MPPPQYHWPCPIHAVLQLLWVLLNATKQPCHPLILPNAQRLSRRQSILRSERTGIALRSTLLELGLLSHVPILAIFRDGFYWAGGQLQIGIVESTISGYALPGHSRWSTRCCAGLQILPTPVVTLSIPKEMNDDLVSVFSTPSQILRLGYKLKYLSRLYIPCLHRVEYFPPTKASHLLFHFI